ncbi:MAG: tetratricopeptide repeat protein [Gemmatimonadales bacterium]
MRVPAIRFALALGSVVLFTSPSAAAQDPPPVLSPEARRAYEERLAEARRAYDRTPNDPDSLIWLGRRTAYLGRYRDAIAIYTEGIAKHPRDARMYRHRGHRYLTIRDFPRAIADLNRGLELVQGQPDQVEPDGIPNPRGIPTSTLHSNLFYHLGLAYYLTADFTRAAEVYGQDVARARETGNSDRLVASSYWLYLARRRAGQSSEATAALAPITRELPVIENGSYHRLLLLFRGDLAADSLLTSPGRRELQSVEDVTLAYGVGAWHGIHGRPGEALAIYRRIVASPQWAAFGYIAAEQDVKRGER